MESLKIKTNVKIETVVKILDEITPEEFKEDEEEYTYIVSIRPKNFKLGENLVFVLDMFYEIGISDIRKLELMQSIQENELFPCSTAEAKEVADVTAIPPLRAMRARTNANPGTTMHLFKTKFRMDRCDFESLLTLNDKYSLKMWEDSKF